MVTGRKYTYIVIDDEKWSRKGTIEKLMPLSDSISCIGEASDGLEGLELLAEKQPDIVITDMRMPYMDGKKLMPVLKEKFPDVYIIVISGYKDFDYSMEAIRAKALDYLVKPFSSEDICAVVRQAIRQMGEREAVRNTIHQSQEYVEKLLEEEDRKRLYDSFTGKTEENFEIRSRKYAALRDAVFWITGIVAMPGDTKQGAASCEPQDNGTGQEESHDDGRAKKCPGDLSERNVCFLPHSKAGNTGYLLIAVPSEIVSSESAYCAGIWKQIRQYFPDGSMVGFGGRVDSLAGIAAGMRQSIGALNRCPAFGQDRAPETVFFFRTEADKAEEEKQTGNPGGGWRRGNAVIHIKEAQLRYAIESGNIQEAERLLTEPFRQHGRSDLRMAEQAEDTGRTGKTGASEGTVQLLEIKQAFREAENVVQGVLRQRFTEMEIRSGSASIEQNLDTIFSAEALWVYEKQFIENAIHMLQTGQKEEQQDLIDRVCAYTEMHYMENLTGEYLAERMHVNRSFLSHSFKKKTGKAYVDYLNGIRIRKAEEILRTTKKKAYQVAAETGYDNVRHFYRVFKKVTGMTPEQYRAGK